MKIVIFYATAGIGHKKAAFAIKEAFDRRGAKDVLLEDVLDFTNPFFKKSYNAIYLFLIRYLPTFWGLCYYLLDNLFIYAFLRPIRRMTNHVNSKKFVRFLLETKPDVAIVTHFMSLEVIANLKKKHMLKTRLIAVVTDYRSHSFWLSKNVDLYIAASDYTKVDLVKRGIPPERVKALGIPCAKSFSEEHDREALKSKLGLDAAKRTIFILGGGFGIGPIKSIVLHADESDEDFQGIVVCGHNEKLCSAVKTIAASTRHRFRVHGFVNNVDELMAVSDLLISKPGGITLTEALAAGLPLVVVDPIPGQEMGNYKFLKKENAAAKIRNPKEIKNVISELFRSSKLEILKENIKKIRRVNSAERIIDEAVK